MTNRRLGCRLPPARPPWPTAPIVWTPSFRSSLVFPLVCRSLALVWLARLSLNTRPDEKKESKASHYEAKRERMKFIMAVAAFLEWLRGVLHLASHRSEWDNQWLFTLHFERVNSIGLSACRRYPPAERMVWLDPTNSRCQSAQSPLKVHHFIGPAFSGEFKRYYGVISWEAVLLLQGWALFGHF